MSTVPLLPQVGRKGSTAARRVMRGSPHLLEQFACKPTVRRSPGETAYETANTGGGIALVDVPDGQRSHAVERKAGVQPAEQIHRQALDRAGIS